VKYGTQDALAIFIVKVVGFWNLYITCYAFSSPKRPWHLSLHYIPVLLQLKIKPPFSG